MAKFKITWWEEDEDGDTKSRTEVVEFFDWVGRAERNGVPVGPVIKLTAKKWAEDYAYTMSDKGRFDVVEYDSETPE